MKVGFSGPERLFLYSGGMLLRGKAEINFRTPYSRAPAAFFECCDLSQLWGPGVSSSSGMSLRGKAETSFRTPYFNERQRRFLSAVIYHSFGPVVSSSGGMSPCRKAETSFRTPYLRAPAALCKFERPKPLRGSAGNGRAVRGSGSGRAARRSRSWPRPVAASARG